MSCCSLSIAACSATGCAAWKTAPSPRCGPETLRAPRAAGGFASVARAAQAPVPDIFPVKCQHIAACGQCRELCRVLELAGSVWVLLARRADEALRSRNTHAHPRGIPPARACAPTARPPTMPTRDSFKSRADPAWRARRRSVPGERRPKPCGRRPIRWRGSRPRTARHSSLRRRRWQRWRRDAARHLGNRQQRIHAVQGLGLYRYSSTGTDVLAAVMPARWAAPPAPAMMAFRPRSRALPRTQTEDRACEWADTTRTSCAIPRESSTSDAHCIVSQSDDDPIMIPTGLACR